MSTDQLSTPPTLSPAPATRPPGSHRQRLDPRRVTTVLWVFAVLNYLYCDLVGLMDPESARELLTGELGGMTITPAFLLGASVLMEIPMAMVVVCALAPERIARIATIAAGTLMTVVQAATLFVGAVMPHYAFFSAVEIATTVALVWYAARRWRPGPVPA